MTATERFFFGTWSIVLPEGWIWEDADGTISMFSEDGYGALTATSVQNTNRDVLDADLIEFLEDMKLDRLPREAVQYGDFAGFKVDRPVETMHWSHWYLRRGKILLMVTYNCATEYAGVEESAIAAALSSLKLE